MYLINNSINPGNDCLKLDTLRVVKEETAMKMKTTLRDVNE